MRSFWEDGETELKLNDPSPVFAIVKEKGTLSPV
jgi:hypothetical protein